MNTVTEARMKKILLIDDDTIVISKYKEKLVNAGFEVITAYNGGEGLKKALEYHPDFIFLDIAMPVMNGLVMLRNLRMDDWGKTVPVIMLVCGDADAKALHGLIEEDRIYYFFKMGDDASAVVEKVNYLLKTYP